MSEQMRKLLEDIETQNVINIFLDPKERTAAQLRRNFFKTHVIDVDTNSLKTKTERDFAYVAFREYRYLTQLNALGSSVMLTCAAIIAHSFFRRRYSVFPLVALGTYPAFHYYYSMKYNKRFFDMCNVGEDTELGHKRNVVLRECNEILDREDF